MENQKTNSDNEFRNELQTRLHFVRTLHGIVNPECDVTHSTKSQLEEIDNIYDWEYFKKRFIDIQDSI